MRAASSRFAIQPQISIITAAYNTDPACLDAAAESVLGQAYPFWHWSIADDGSTHAGTRAALTRLAARDPRITVEPAAANGGISAASNLALSRATGEFIALLDHDDVLAPHALYRIVERLNRLGAPYDVLYSDEDKLDARGDRVEPYFKPDWSPDLFRSSMYACHLLVIRRALVDAVGGFRSGFDYAQDYDLLLRVIERTDRIAHVPDVLYHWRKTAGSTALSGEAKPAAHAAGARALQAHLDRTQVQGHIVDAGSPGLYRMKYQVVGRPRVAAVIVSREGQEPRLARTLRALAATTAYPELTVTVVSVQGKLPADASPGLAVAGMPAHGAFNYSAWINQGARRTEGDHLLLLQDDVEPEEPRWLEAMLELSQQPGIGAVGAKLFDRNGKLEHIGLAIGLMGAAASPFAGFDEETATFYSGAGCIRNCAAVSTACAMIRREVFDAVNGLDEALPAPAAEIDLGLRLAKAGYRVVFTPYARVTLHETTAVPPAPLDVPARAHLESRWGRSWESDPFYNPHFSRDHLDGRLR
jgi:GT2 family glycosyltransferase